MSTRRALIALAALAGVVLAVQLAHHATQRQAVGQVMSGRLLDLNTTGEDAFRRSLAEDLAGVGVAVPPAEIRVLRDGDAVRVAVRYERRAGLGPLGWDREIVVSRESVDLGM